MILEKIQPEDIIKLSELQPEDWDDIRPHFSSYISSPFCEPLKITDEGKIAGVGSYIRHKTTAWLAHIIVHKDHRNKGFGLQITNALLKSLKKYRIRTVYLIATELGYPVYLKAGFELESEYVHFNGECLNKVIQLSPSIIPFDKKYREDILKLDRAVSGEYRERIITENIESLHLFLKRNKVRGVYFPALKDGLIIACDEEAGTELMKLRMTERETAGFPADNITALNFFTENGFTRIKNSKRMIYGKLRKWKPERLYNRISGGLG
ncbi:MAG TPA: GNAT family N-acetyltransferase [Ignavibacteria bacterium]|nr:GNAT family N-acetyltransferase [Ignavibacteria bacterium]